ncbi:aspartate aminotransferase family protein [Halobacillus sp. Nhm2S1]|uniref:pyridoxal phosphate-dependent decarboxylase family protein n=1 Tax=Halobacillus sp. Nhm2S1 TaxID=2866716 RepID=UPI001C731125|nr:aspartate aminotransferase family protein [Halobacillus sp. Nhm2S1]MBX0356895.1 aspartate aminotransferase family protein [Halobacillus sp. Nhm2S1]
MITTTNQSAVSAFDSFFLQHGEEGGEHFRNHVELVVDILAEVFQTMDRPLEGKTVHDIQQELRGVLTLSEEPQSLQEVLKEIKGPVIRNSLHVSHERSMAHLHCPPVLPGVLAELIIGALNQSMDSWDQSPAATYVEEELIRYWCQLIGLSEQGDGVFTSGGTQSNYMGMLLARDEFCLSEWGHIVQKDGLPESFKKMRVLCSEEAHFSVKKSVSQLGLGEQAVVPVPVNEDHRMDHHEVRHTVEQLEQEGLLPYAVVSTCGTTDYGSIDPLDGLADLCEEKGLWLHVDAAYGAGLLLSEKHGDKLSGMDRADSVTLDFHKWLFQPISCGMFAVKDRKHLRLLSHHADYLNPEEDEKEGIVNLVNKSIQTTRRFDALKVLLTLKVLGTRLLGSMVDRTMEVARFAAGELEKRFDFCVENPSPELSAVVFQYQPEESRDVCGLNRKIQQKLFHEGTAVIAKTSVRGETYLKFTILNPRTTEEDVLAVIDQIEHTAKQILGGTPH